MTRVGNTPPATLHPDFPPGGNRTGGEDWFEACIYLRWKGFERMRDALDAAKRKAWGGGTRCQCTLPGAIATYQIGPLGCYLGKGKGGPLMAWTIVRSGITIGLADRADPHDTMPSGFVRIPGEVLSALGDARVVWEEVVRWLAELGASIERAVVSRVDMCVDMPGMKVDPFVHAFSEGRTIRRARKACTYRQDKDPETESVYYDGRSMTGLSVGTGTRVRIYDKAVECCNLFVRHNIQTQRWAGKDCKNAARVEFQLRRSFLKAEKHKQREIDRPIIDTVQDYFDHRAELAEYLVTRWMRFVQPGFDIRHTERAVDIPEWDAVRKAFASWTGDTGGVRTFTKIKRSTCRVKDLLAQVRGCMESAFARLCEDVDGAEDFMGQMNKRVWEIIEADGDIRARVAAKRLDLVTEMMIDDDDPNNPPDDGVPF